jgi:hypothetical protein
MWDRMLPLLRLTCVVLVAIGAARCQETPRAAARDWPLSEITEHDVTVSLKAVVDDAGQTWVEGRFTPTRDGFHLYAKDLPRDGLSGIGRPTLLEVPQMVPSPRAVPSSPTRRLSRSALTR